MDCKVTAQYRVLCRIKRYFVCSQETVRMEYGMSFYYQIDSPVLFSPVLRWGGCTGSNDLQDGWFWAGILFDRI